MSDTPDCRSAAAMAAAREVLTRLDRLEAVVGSHEAVLRALIEHHNNVTAVLVMQQETIKNMLGVEPKPPTAVN